MPGPKPLLITLTDPDRRELERLVRAQHTPQALALRARLILAAAAGETNAALARQFAVDVDTVRLWRTRWATSTIGTAAERLADAPRSGAPVRIAPEAVCQIVALACEAPQEADRPISHWSGRELADEAMARGIVATISPRHAARLLKRGSCSRTAVAIG